MSEVALRVENLGKRYRLGQRENLKTRTLKNAALGLLTAPVRWLAPRAPDNELWALRDVSFEVKRGEVLGVIGRNGAGKSTLLKILSRITKPTNGYAKINGRVGSLLEVGTGFHPELTGRENIFLNGSILGMRRHEIEKKFDEIVAFSEVEKFIDTPVKRYSSGMYMRLAFAVAAHLEPEILIVDEVLAVGDIQFQKKCLGKVSDVSRSGRTVLFVSHNMTAIEQLCHSVVLLEQGQLVSQDTNVQLVISKYLSVSEHLQERSEWIRKDNKYDNRFFKLLRFRLVDEDNNTVQRPVNKRENIWVEIDLEISKLDPMLVIGYSMFTETNIPLFWSLQVDLQSDRWPELKIGRCILKSQIRLDVLNEGTYRLDCNSGLHLGEWFFVPGENVPSLFLDVLGGLSQSSYWVIRRPGVMAVETKWEVIYL
jgi:lipopolysaccharide transport system ATP-binding protein